MVCSTQSHCARPFTAAAVDKLVQTNAAAGSITAQVNDFSPNEVPAWPSEAVFYPGGFHPRTARFPGWNFKTKINQPTP